MCTACMSVQWSQKPFAVSSAIDQAGRSLRRLRRRYHWQRAAKLSLSADNSTPKCETALKSAMHQRVAARACALNRNDYSSALEQDAHLLHLAKALRTMRKRKYVTNY